MFEDAMYNVRSRFSQWTGSDVDEPFGNLAGKMLCLCFSRIIMSILQIFICIGGCITYGLMKIADELSPEKD